jgi:hypothetical protein
LEKSMCCSPLSRPRLASWLALVVISRECHITLTIRPLSQPMMPVQLHGSSRWGISWQAGGVALAKYGLERTVVNQAAQSLDEIFAELPVQRGTCAVHAFAHAAMVGYGPVAKYARLHWPFVSSHSELTQQSGWRPLVHSSLTHPSQMSTGLSQGWQHVSHTSHPEKE